MDPALVVEYKLGQSKETELVELLRSKGFEVLPPQNKSYDFSLLYVDLSHSTGFREVTCDLKVQYTSFETFIIEVGSVTTNSAGQPVKNLYETSVLLYKYDFLVMWQLEFKKLFFISRPELETYIRQNLDVLPLRFSQVNFNPQVGAHYKTLNVVIHPDQIRHLILLELDLSQPDWDQSLGCFRRTP